MVFRCYGSIDAMDSVKLPSANFFFYKFKMATSKMAVYNPRLMLFGFGCLVQVQLFFIHHNLSTPLGETCGVDFRILQVVRNVVHT